MTDPLYRPLLFSEGSGPVSHRTPLLHNVRLQYHRSDPGDLLHAVKHFIKFQISVTVDTWIRGAAVFVGIYKPVHNLCMEICGKIKTRSKAYPSDRLRFWHPQHRPGNSRSFPCGHRYLRCCKVFMVAPMHSSPDSFVKRAATELSTPPLIAMIAFFIYILTFPDD